MALQPLYLLNSPLMVKRAAAFADRVALLAGDDTSRQVAAAFELALGRRPDNEELRAGKTYLKDGGATTTPRSRLPQFCHVLLNLNEFAYVR